MDKLRLKYKLAIIPKDTILFRKAPDNGIYESMYFSFNSSGTYSSDFNSGPTQQWKTKQTIISRFIVKGKISPLIYENDLAADPRLDPSFFGSSFSPDYLLVYTGWTASIAVPTPDALVKTVSSGTM